MTVRITSIGTTRFGKREEGLVQLMGEAASLALEGAPTSFRRPEALFVGSMMTGALAGVESLVPKVAHQLDLAGTPGFHVQAASATGAAVFQSAVASVAAGHFDTALVVAGEKMTGHPSEVTTTALARSLSPEEIAHGATMPSMAALVSIAYADRYEVPMQSVGQVTVANRRAAAQNPLAHFQKPVVLEEVNQSRMVSSPLRLLHVSPVSDGASAIVVSRSHGGVVVAGIGQGTDVVDVSSRKDLTTFAATRSAARRAYEQAHLTRKEVAVAELHDAFAPFELVDLEDVGLCGPGEGLSWLEAGKGGPNGIVPINPSGGLLGRGHPVGASGLVQIAELFRQLTGDAGALQAGQPKIGLAQSVGGLGSHNFVTILRREEGP